MDTLIEIATTFVVFVVIPYVLILIQRWVNLHIKNANELRWANGAISFAGQAYTALLTARQADPTVPLPTLIDRVVSTYSIRFQVAYAQTGEALDATTRDSESRVAGALGPMLASDPTISLAVLHEIASPADKPPGSAVHASEVVSATGIAAGSSDAVYGQI